MTDARLRDFIAYAATLDGDEKGDFCFLACKDDPIDKCPAAYNCEHIEAPDAGIDGFFCVRACWLEPI